MFNKLKEKLSKRSRSKNKNANLKENSKKNKLLKIVNIFSYILSLLFIIMLIYGCCNPQPNKNNIKPNNLYQSNDILDIDNQKESKPFNKENDSSELSSLYSSLPPYTYYGDLDDCQCYCYSFWNSFSFDDLELLVDSIDEISICFIDYNFYTQSQFTNYITFYRDNPNETHYFDYANVSYTNNNYYISLYLSDGSNILGYDSPLIEIDTYNRCVYCLYYPSRLRNNLYFPTLHRISYMFTDSYTRDLFDYNKNHYLPVFSESYLDFETTQSFAEGRNVGFEEGAELGYIEGYDYGYSVGYQRAIDDSNQQLSQIVLDSPYCWYEMLSKFGMPDLSTGIYVLLENEPFPFVSTIVPGEPVNYHPKEDNYINLGNTLFRSNGKIYNNIKFHFKGYTSIPYDRIAYINKDYLSINSDDNNIIVSDSDDKVYAIETSDYYDLLGITPAQFVRGFYYLDSVYYEYIPTDNDNNSSSSIVESSESFSQVNSILVPSGKLNPYFDLTSTSYYSNQSYSDLVFTNVLENQVYNSVYLDNEGNLVSRPNRYYGVANLQSFSWINKSYQSITILSDDNLPSVADSSLGGIYYYFHNYSLRDLFSSINGIVISNGSYTTTNLFDLMTMGFNSVNTILNISILPNISLGLLLFFPILITLIIIIFKVVHK